MDNIYRKYLIQELIGEPLLSDEENSLIKFILDKIKDLNMFVDMSGGISYLNKNGDFVYMVYGGEYDILMDYKTIVVEIETVYKKDFFNVVKLIKNIMTKVLNIRVDKISYGRTNLIDKIEKEYKIKHLNI